MSYKMLRRTKSSSLLPIVKLTNYFYPESPSLEMSETGVMDIYQRRGASSGRLTPPPDYEQLYQAMQVENMTDPAAEERVRKKYACQGSITHQISLTKV